MTRILATGERRTGDFGSTRTYGRRTYSYVPTPGHPDHRLGNLTLVLTRGKAGAQESDTYALEDGGYLPGLMGRSFWLTNLTDPAAVEPYEVVLGPLGRCGCMAGQCRGRKVMSCKHRDALARMVADGVFGDAAGAITEGATPAALSTTETEA